jgi:hypothetical protein
MRRHFPSTAVYVIIFLVYAALRIASLNAIHNVREFPDTQDYQAKASWPLLSWGQHTGPLEGISIWWLQGRPPTVPFFYKLLGKSPNSIAGFQLALSILCWGLLALSVARAVRVPQLRPIVFVAILVFSLNDYIVLWDGVLLSESISISLMALLMAVWFWLIEGWHRQKVVLLLVVAFAWAFARDSNAWAILVLAALLTAIAVLRRSRRYAVIGAAFVLLFVANDVSDNWSKRWQIGFMNVMGQRILPDQERTLYFVKRGMPLTPAVTRFAGHYVWDFDMAFDKDPALTEFRRWLDSRGRLCYVQFLVTHPRILLGQPVRNAGAVGVHVLDFYKPAGFSPILSGALAGIIYPDTNALLWWRIGSILAASILFSIGFESGPGRWLTALTLICLAYPHAAIVWHADSYEFSRHALQVAVHLRIGLLLTLLFAVDVVFVHLTSTKLGNNRVARERQLGPTTVQNQ